MASTSAFLLGLAIKYACSFSDINLSTSYGLIYFLGAPLGSILGIYILERFVCKSKIIASWAMVLSFCISVIGVFLITIILPIYDLLDISEWFFALLGRRIDWLISTASASLFCVLGYNFAKFITDIIHSTVYAINVPKNKLAKSPDESRRIITRRKVAFSVFCVSIALVFLGVVFRAKVFNREPKARAFLEQIIKSINEDTNLYKEEFQGITWRKRDPWAYLDQVSNDYEIILVKSDFDEGGYEYSVIFDKKTEFYAVVVDYGKHYTLEVFRPGKPY